MEFGLLGPLLVDTGEGRIEVNAPKQRIVLAALLLRANRVVSAERLTELVWDGRPPAGARTALQNHVMRLRTTLAGPAAERIRTSGPGYLIDVHPGELDLDRFLDLEEQGCRAASEGDWSRARTLLVRALGEWRDEALLDVPSELLRTEEAGQLGERRERALSARIDADLEFGGHEAAIPAIRQLIERRPLNERPYGQLMLALYRSGRQADALAVYRDLRALLVEELGIEPCAELRELHQRILTTEPSLPEPSPEDAPAPAAPGPRRRLTLGTASLPLAALLLCTAAGLHFLTGAPPARHDRHVARTSGDAQILSTSSVDLPVLTPVTAGDALVVSLTLTDTTPGEVTVTDTAGDDYQAIGDLADSYGHRTMIFAAFQARRLTSADRITAAYPRSSKYEIAVDEFRGLTGAGPQAATATSTYERNKSAFSTSATPLPCAPGDLLLSAIASNSGPAPALTGGWQTLPALKLSSYRLTTAYRSATAEDNGSCAATGTTTAQWGAVLVTLR